MRATLMYAAGDVRVEDVPDPSIVEPTDAIIRVTSACVCGSDLWPYADLEPTETGRPMGHEAIGLVEDVGPDVHTVKPGDLVVMPFAFSDGTCAFCHEGLHTACVHGGFFDGLATGAAQAEAVRVPLADGTLYALPVGEDDTLMPSLLTLSDVLGTGHHAAVVAGVKPGDSVAVVGDGAVGLCGVIAAKRLGAEQIIIMGRHEDRTDLARDLGATDVVAERGDEAVQRIMELTGGSGVHGVLECVGTEHATETSVAIARPGGAVGRVGVPHYETIPLAQPMFFKNVKVGGGPAPVRAYIDELLRDVLDGTIEPGRVFDRTVGLEGGAGRLPRDGRPRVDQGPGEALMQITRSSIDTQKGPADWFTGDVYIDAVAAPEATSTFAAALVHFTPGARTAWHTHPHGQTIFVTEGVGRCQREGGPIEEIRPGDRVFFEPGENHWPAPRPTASWPTSRCSRTTRPAVPWTWGEHVTDEQYAGGRSA